MRSLSLQAAFFLILSLMGSVPLSAAIVVTVVEDHSGGALDSAEVRVLRLGAAELIADLESNSNGRLELPDLPSGDYRIEVSKPNYLTTTLQVRVANGTSGSLVAHIIRCGAISGRVIDAEGQAVRSATVFAMTRRSERGPLQPFAKFERGHEAHVEENGEYRLFNLPPGPYAVAVTYGASTVVVGSTGGSQIGSAGSGVLYYPVGAQPRIFEVSGGEEYHDVDFSIAPSALHRVSGKVDLAAPQLGYWLALTSESQPVFTTAVTQATEDGSFHFEGIPAGSYLLFASGPSHGRGSQGAIIDQHSCFGRLPLEVGADVANISIPVQKGRSVSFILRNIIPGDHRCAETMEMRLSSIEDWGADLERTAMVGFGEPKRFENLAPSRYLLTAHDTGAECYTVSDTAVDLVTAQDNNPIAVPVAPKGSIRGRLMAENQQSSHRTIELLPAYPEGSDSLLKVTFADSAARFAFERLRPGRYRIAARPSDDLAGRWISDLNRRREIDVKPGVVTDVELPLPSGEQSPKE